MTSPLQPHQMLRIGQPVHVNHHASWLPATVTCVATRHVGVTYHHGVPAQLADTVLPWAVRPADGAQLRPARRIATGDRVIFGSTVRTVAAPPYNGRGGWLVLQFTDSAQPALIHPGAVLRLIDDTPQVTVDGRSLTTH